MFASLGNVANELPVCFLLVGTALPGQTMKLAILAALLSTVCYATVSHSMPKKRALQLAVPATRTAPKGIWYMADSGHAVYCYGPVVNVASSDGGVKRVATFCRGKLPMAALKD